MEVMSFGHKYHKSDGVSFSGHHYQGCIISIYLITGDVNLTNFIKVVSARFLCHKMTIFSFVIDKYLQIPCFFSKTVCS